MGSRTAALAQSKPVPCLGMLQGIDAHIATAAVAVAVAGMRMYAADWCECPQCRFPGTGQGLMAVLAAEGTCPMCSAAVAPAQVRQVTQPLQHWSCARLEAPGGRAAGPPAAVPGPWG